MIKIIQWITENIIKNIIIEEKFEKDKNKEK
jgi:hypothetical protein